MYLGSVIYFGLEYGRWQISWTGSSVSVFKAVYVTA